MVVKFIARYGEENKDVKARRLQPKTQLNFEKDESGNIIKPDTTDSWSPVSAALKGYEGLPPLFLDDTDLFSFNRLLK